MIENDMLAVTYALLRYFCPLLLCTDYLNFECCNRNCRYFIKLVHKLYLNEILYLRK